MNNKILIAIVAAFATILGTLVTKTLDLISNWQRNRQERRKELFKVQRNVYWKFLLSLQRLMNEENNENFYNFQEQVDKVLLYGDNKTSQIISDYYQELIKKANFQIRDLNHKEYQTKIINAMRKHLNMDRLEKFELICFNPRSTKE